MLEPEDFYINEEGLMVLTEKYHLKRGKCCGNACKHCPFDWINVEEKKRNSLKITKKNQK